MALSDNVIQEINDYIQVQGLEWAKDFIAYRKSWLEKRGIKASGELINSMQSELVSTLEGAAKTRIEIAFNVYGRFVDMKNLHAPAGGSAYIESLENWIESKGLRDKLLQNWIRKRNAKTVPTNILNQLAWSVAVSRHQRVKRRRQWWNKPKSAAISELYNKVAANLPNLIADEIKKAFNN